MTLLGDLEVVGVGFRPSVEGDEQKKVFNFF